MHMTFDPPYLPWSEVWLQSSKYTHQTLMHCRWWDKHEWCYLLAWKQSMVQSMDQSSLTPRPSTRVKRVWCCEQHFLSHPCRANLRCEITNQFAEVIISAWHCILNRIGGSESLSYSLTYMVPSHVARKGAYRAFPSFFCDFEKGQSSVHLRNKALSWLCHLGGVASFSWCVSPEHYTDCGHVNIVVK